MLPLVLQYLVPPFSSHEQRTLLPFHLRTLLHALATWGGTIVPDATAVSTMLLHAVLLTARDVIVHSYDEYHVVMHDACQDLIGSVQFLVILFI